MGGSLEIFFGTKFPIYHKVKKAMFKFGTPFIILAQIMIAIFLFELK